MLLKNACHFADIAAVVATVLAAMAEFVDWTERAATAVDARLQPKFLKVVQVSNCYKTIKSSKCVNDDGLYFRQ